MPRYQKIHSQLWHDEKICKLSDNSKLLFLYILSCPHSNSIGVFVLKKGYICSDLNWNARQLKNPFQELTSKDLILYDETVDLLCIPGHLKHNPIENENQAKAALKNIRALPISPLYKRVLELLHKPYHKQLRELLQEQYREQIPKPETETIQEQKKKTEKETYGEFVLLTKDQHQKLIDSSNANQVVREVENLNNYLGSTGKTYKSHYHTILNWRGKKTDAIPIDNWVNEP